MSATIALVDDDAGILDAVGMILQLEGWQVCGYSRGEALLIDIDRCKPDCVVLDPNLGFGISSVEVAKSVVKKAIPIIGLTARPSGPMALALEDIGVRVMLTKPVSPEDLIDHIQNVLGEVSK